jgi:hypothetical protein
MTHYLTNDRNLVRTATLTASSLVASTAIRRTDTDEKAGGGRVSLGGAFTGASDATYEIEITDTGGSTAAVSSPVFSGSGSGELSDVAIDPGVDPQTFVVTLEDLGTVTRQAYAPFQSATLRAKDSGPDGNDITLTVDASGLTYTPTGFAVRVAMAAEQGEFVGDEFNFGAATLNVDGTLPESASRIVFGDDPQVYRPWRKYVAGRYVYGFSPTLARDVPAGARVKTVSGTRNVVISDGTTTDTLNGIVTLYDCLREIRDNSTLVEVDGVIVNDLLPGGQAAVDLSVWTQPYVARTIREGTDYIRLAEVPIAVDATAPTEVLEIQCVNTSVPGYERWRVHGQASGRLADAITGELYADGGYQFTVPRPPESESSTAGATIRVEYRRPNYNGSDPLPGVCFRNVTLGPAAVNGTKTYVYSPRPEPDCDCNETELRGALKLECIGAIPEEDEIVSNESRRRRLQRLADWVDSHVRSNTGVPGSSADSVDQDITFVRTGSAILAECLSSMMDGALTWPAWEASTAYTVDAVHEPTTANGYRYAVTVAGTSSASEPTWPTTIGDTVTDGGVTWENIGKLPLLMWDDVFALLKSDAEVLRDFGVVLDPFASYYILWAATTAVSLGERLAVVLGNQGGSWSVFECTTAGTTAATEPTWPDEPGATVADGTVVWTRIGGDSKAGDAAVDDAYYDRYRMACNAVLAAAEISPDFEGASGQGDGCWQDDPDQTYWWAPTDDYAPIFSNVFYHSSRLLNGPKGDLVAQTTREFAFGPQVGCPDLLMPGDEIVVSINGVNGVQTYQQGDLIVADITRAVPLEFGGGQTGNDTLTFSVVGSVDGRLLDYELYTPLPVAYDDGGVSFLITPGGIDFALGDTFTFAVEGGRFRWRKDGGGWSSATDIDSSTPPALSDGLTVVFSAGTAPSWVPGDVWTFEALAINGPDQLRQPTPDVFSWTSSQQLVIEPASTSSATELAILEHSIAASASISIEGSNDNFVTTPLNAPVTWAARNIWMSITGAYAKYRITINDGGGIRWLFLGDGLKAQIRSGAAELGLATRRHRLPSRARRSALAVSIAHEALTQDSVDALLAAFDHAGAEDEGLLGIVLGGGSPVPAIVRLGEDSIEITDVFGYQPANAANRLLALSLDLEAVE